MSELELHVVGPDGKRVLALGKRPLRIGRSPDNDIPLPQDRVLSRIHCVIEFKDGHHYLRDLDSRHGSWISGRKIKVHKLIEGDTILIGRSKLNFTPPGGRRQAQPLTEDERPKPQVPEPSQEMRPPDDEEEPSAIFADSADEGLIQPEPPPKAPRRREAAPSGRRPRPTGRSGRGPRPRGPATGRQRARPVERRRSPSERLKASDPGEPPRGQTGRHAAAEAAPPPVDRQLRKKPAKRSSTRKFTDPSPRKARSVDGPPPGGAAEARPAGRSKPNPSRRDEFFQAYSQPGAEHSESAAVAEPVETEAAASSSSHSAVAAPVDNGDDTGPIEVASSGTESTFAGPNPIAEELASGELGVAEAPKAERSAEAAPRIGGKLRLPTGWPGGHAPYEPRNPAQQLLMRARKIDASDVHLTPNLPVTFRVGGEIRLDGPRLTAGQVEAFIDAITTDEQRAYFNATGDYDYCYAFEKGGRFRTNICRHRVGNALTFRVVKGNIASLEELGIPAVAEKLTQFAQGLVLVSGPMGSGKTTSLYALVRLVNETRPEHIITIEDPVEFVMRGAQSHVSQRELGIHTESFDAALRAALREDPDIIVIGDLRDYDTTSLAIKAAETGHLVFASMHSMNAVKSIDKLLDMFPASEQATIRTIISESLRGILCQRLVPSIEAGRVPAVELLFNSVAVANIIRENKTASLFNAMELGRAQGMCTLDMSLRKLFNDEIISGEVAYRFAENKDRFRNFLPPEPDDA